MAKKALFISLAALFVTSSVGATFFSNSAGAVTASDWSAGRIIDDAVFYDKNAMSAAQIQAFLNAKVPTCDRNRPSSNPNYQPPWTCLKEYQENTTTKENNVGRFNSNGTPYNVPGSKSAAQIIWEAGQNYGINPQVLMIMLQKEQSLITDNWPWKIQYNKAMGYACPDTAPCDSQYYGLFNQISSAAWQLKRYGQYPDSYNFKAGVTRYIGYSPNAACGGSNVYIENMATAALYNYTPYQPNAGALSNMYGTSNCGAYGNRNFWRMFNDWFGSTLAPSYGWKVVSQASFEDNTLAKSLDTSIMPAGERRYVVLRVQNSGSLAWQKYGPNPTRLGASNPQERNSPFRDVSWIGPNRVTPLEETTVEPGQIGTFKFWYRAPAPTGVYTEFFTPLTEGKSWHKGSTFSIKTNVTPRSHGWKVVYLNSFTNQTSGITKDTRTLAQSDRAFVIMKAQNLGNVSWYNSGPNPTRLGVAGPHDRASNFGKYKWVNGNRPANMLEKVVKPGEVGTFAFWHEAPMNSGDYFERFNLVTEGVTWHPDVVFGLKSNIVNPQYNWQITSQFAYTDETRVTHVDLTTLSPSQRVYIGVNGINKGNIAWRPDGGSPIRIGTSGPRDKTSIFCDPTWLSCARPTTITGVVEPGQTGSFGFWYKAPPSPVTYTQESFDLLAEGKTWFNDVNLLYTTTVN